MTERERRACRGSDDFRSTAFPLWRGSREILRAQHLELQTIHRGITRGLVALELLGMQEEMQSQDVRRVLQRQARRMFPGLHSDGGTV